MDQFSKYTALVSENGEHLSYSDLLNFSDIFSEKIGEHCLIFILCSNCIESAIGYIGCIRRRIVPALLDKSIDITLLRELLENYHPKFCWVPTFIAGKITGKRVYSFRNYTLISTKYEQDYQLYHELGLLLATSGSTGSPKFVRQSYQNIQSNTESIIKYLKIVQNDRAISTMPMNYTYGLSILNTHLATGASEILTEATLMDKRFWKQLREEKATTFGGVPYIYEMLKKLRFNKMELPNLRYVTQAGGKLSAELCSEFSKLCEDRHMEFIVMYGQTEATARMAWLPFQYAQEKVGSIGIAIPGGRFSLIDADNNEIINPNIAGELLYYGDNVSLGYAQNRFDLSLGDDNHGVLHTGDIAKRDEDGFYYIIGRKKRFLKIFGNRVNLDEVERLLKKEGIECACTGIDDCLKIFITDPSLKEKAGTYIDNHTAISHGGFKVIVIEKIPRNPSGKVLYSEIKNYD
ncbi:AMP-dependent synthetase [bacterium 1XD42-1]|nr:AMP-dependent synthetase [bacterium 1XD42-8]RKJ64575.1 AMP-dependent synthetase [bacterium 1XD42-1]